ncbi:SDR family NAD(P)-dependent oxidoreductase [Paenibacillus filicis]|uniref:SDR family NAD(P)-dependent oxidoreductase n=1 Tax=Paenibacillus gyeongsangnamensis TaxID=3388067 RepID=A0ABT4Q797_9BACL|nr:SDR family NAD(P)-dependent oxidoreductase [Paenibacillus filicis]MCZ8512748.1 SDR family NAD(P)-dependent oxidoreductase [Paenibacillus filicis]
MIRAFAPLIAKNGGGTILNIFSVLSWFSNGTFGAYTAAKAGAWGMTNELRLNLHPQNIKVAALHVGLLDTDMSAGINTPKIDPVDVAS